MQLKITPIKTVIFILIVSLIFFLFLSSKDEISNRFLSNENTDNIASVYDKFKNNEPVDNYLNDLLTLEKNSKGMHGYSLNFFYKSKTNCLNLFKHITPLYYETREREYKLEENPKPARVCHTNYEFGDLNFVKIYR